MRKSWKFIVKDRGISVHYVRERKWRGQKEPLSVQVMLHTVSNDTSKKKVIRRANTLFWINYNPFKKFSASKPAAKKPVFLENVF